MPDKQLIKIYSFFYKEGGLLTDDPVYSPVIAGKKLLRATSFMTGDDTGEQISAKNKYYSELTGIYWVWKNTDNDITGSCHYRRYFTTEDEPIQYKLKRILYWAIGINKKRYGLIYSSNTGLFAPKILKGEQTQKLLEKYDAILPQKRKLKYTVKKHYEKYHNAGDLEILENIIVQCCPEYREAYNTVLNQKCMHANNMFVLHKKEYEEFMQWWFGMLFRFEERAKLKNYTGYQERVLGFIAERLLNVWFCHKNLKVKELPIIYFKKLKNKDCITL